MGDRGRIRPEQRRQLDQLVKKTKTKQEQQFNTSMNLVNPYRFAAQESGYLPEYDAILDEATLQGYTLPSAGQQAKQNDLVGNLITAGIWAKLDGLWIFVNDSGKNYSYLNWINPAGPKCSEENSGTLTFVSNAYIRNAGAGSRRINTNVSFASLTNYQRNSGTAGFINQSCWSVSTDDKHVGLADDGVTQSSNALWLYDSNFACRFWFNKSGSASVNFGSGFRRISQGTNRHIAYRGLDQGSNTVRCILYLNGVLQSNLGPVSTTGKPSGTLLLSDGIFEWNRQVSYIGASLTNAEMTSLHTHLRDYIDNINT